MKKTLIAIAALAATGAFAQSTVTISGMIDAGYAVTTSSGVVNGTTGVVTTASTATNNVQSTTASRMRFVGASDLGGGMKGNFWLEMQPNITDGTVSSAGLFNRGAWAGISGSFGEIRLGRQGTNTIAAVVTPDIQQGGAFYAFSGGGLLFSGMGAAGAQGSAWFAANPTRGGFGQASSTANASQVGAVANPVDATRYNRAIRYSTPVLAGGLTVSAMTAFGGLAANSPLGAGGGSQGVDAVYAAGPLRAVFAYQKANAEALDAGNNTGSLTTLSGNYDFGKFILGGAIQSEKASGANIVFNSGKSLGLVGMLPMGSFRPYVKLGSHSYDTMGTNAKIFNIGTTYDLSKTTKLYVDYTKNSASFTGTATSGTVAANNVVANGAQQSPRLVVAGLQVNF